VLVDSTKPIILLASANGVVESEGMKPRQKYIPGVRAAVQFEVKDVALAENPVSIWFSSDGSTWSELAKGQPADAAFRFEVPDKPTRRLEA